MGGTGRASAALLATAALLLARPAQATEIRDGADYSVTVPGDAHPCIVFPQAMFDRAACPPDAKPLASLPLGEQTSALAVGSLGLDDGSRVMLVVTRAAGDDVSPPGDLAAFARGMAEAMANGRPGAKVRGTPAATLVQVNGLQLVRGSFDMDGYAEGGPAHEVAYAAWAQGGLYALSLTGLVADTPAVDALGYRLIATLHVAHPSPIKPGTSRDYRLGYVVGKALGAVLFPAIAIGWFVLFLRRDRRKRLQSTARGA
jgi:hypothetical protein